MVGVVDFGGLKELKLF